MFIIERLWHSFETWAIGFGGLAFLVGVILIVLWFFTPAFLSNQAAKALVLNVGLGCIAFALVSGYFINIGFKSCVNVTAGRDQAAIGRKNQGLEDIEKCGVDNWDITAGKCNAPQ